MKNPILDKIRKKKKIKKIPKSISITNIILDKLIYHCDTEEIDVSELTEELYIEYLEKNKLL